RFSRSDDPADRDVAFATLHQVLAILARVLAPILPFPPQDLSSNLVRTVVPSAPDSVHLTRWPAAEIAACRDESLEASMAIARLAVDRARTRRGQGGLP